MDLWGRVPTAWRAALRDFEPDIARIGVHLDELAAEVRVLPAPDQVFRALQVAPADVRVVIVGQDPYPNPAHACGLAFSVPSGVGPLPPSLRNILDEVRADCGGTAVVEGDLQPWVDQGVLLLNRTLTVTAGSVGSHNALGWRPITRAIVEAVTAADPQVPAILWGAAAQELTPLFDRSSVVASAHPSPLSAHRGFRGSRPFSTVNALLQQRQRTPIRW